MCRWAWLCACACVYVGAFPRANENACVRIGWSRISCLNIYVLCIVDDKHVHSSGVPHNQQLHAALHALRLNFVRLRPGTCSVEQGHACPRGANMRQTTVNNNNEVQEYTHILPMSSFCAVATSALGTVSLSIDSRQSPGSISDANLLRK